MARGKRTRRDHKNIDKTMNAAMADRIQTDDANVDVPPMVYLPPTINGKPTQIVERVANRGLPSVRDNIVRIQREADPLAFLIAVANGQVFPVHIVDEHGKVTTEYESPTLNQRMRAAQYLAEKMLPRMGVLKIVGADGKPGETRPDGAPMTFDQAVERAAANLMDGRPMLENRIVDAEAVESDE